MASKERDLLDWAENLIMDWIRQRKYGQIYISLENGRIVNLQRKENLKPPETLEEKKSKQKD